MLSRRLYYAVKPALPWGFRMTVRRWLARRVLRRPNLAWPIDEQAGQPPEGWKGWPEGRQFALVLTHDVEGPDGLAKVRALAELEMAHGFRSSFNFIPEGPYEVPSELRSWLTAHDFEVGVHDHRHDGKLFRSRRDFQQGASRINEHLRAWGAQGFRGGFMLRNLDWIHDLAIAYDASTFDTDPFEPQPENARTIFPYWIPAPGSGGTVAPGKGYLELPYTLPQDSTLFLLLREQSPAVWLQKLDWIAARGGMALLNVHPDYIRFSGEKESSRTYPVAHYEKFLRHLREQYDGRFHHALCRDLAAWWVRERPAGPVATPVIAAAAVSEPTLKLRGRRAAVLLYSDYPADPRPRRAAEAMVESGMEVDLLCLGEDASQPVREVVCGVNVHRLRLQRRREGIHTYLWLYSRFIAASFWFLTWRHLRRRYDLVHVHNMPDVLVFAALVPRLAGAKVLLDLHDPMPELITTIFGFAPGSAPVRLLKVLERLSIGFAHHVITVNQACKRIFSERDCPPAKISVVMNSPDERIFASHAPTPPVRHGGPLVFMYHGSLVERHGLDLAVGAIAAVRRRGLPAVLRVYGRRTPYLEQVLQSITDPDLRMAVEYLGPRNLTEIAQAIRECDVGIIPNRRSLFTEINTPTRIFEYLSQMRPVIAPAVPGILDYFAGDDLLFFQLGDQDDLTRAVAYAIEQPEATAETARRGYRVYQRHRWSQERARLLGLAAAVLGPTRPAGLERGVTAANRPGP